MEWICYVRRVHQQPQHQLVRTECSFFRFCFFWFVNKNEGGRAFYFYLHVYSECVAHPDGVVVSWGAKDK